MSIDLKYKKGKYLAFVLDKISRDALLGFVKPKFSEVICHHVTIEFKLTEERFDTWMKAYADNPPPVVITGISRGNDVECFTAELDEDNRRRDGGWYHITLSVEPPARPVDSNGLLLKTRGTPTDKFKTPIRVTGTYELR
jgi:hypothetical protein